MPKTEPYNRNPVLLGSAPQLNDRPVWLHSKQQDLSMHIMGLPGMGKSRFMQSLIEQDIENGRGICLIDPHGSLVTAVLEWLQTQPYLLKRRKIVILDPTDTSWTFGFNPFVKDLGGHVSPSYYVDSLIDAIARIYGKQGAVENPTIFSNLRALFYVLMTNNLSLADAGKLIHPKDPTGLRRELTAQGSIDNESVQDRWDYLNDMTDKEYRNDFIGPYNRLMGMLFPPQLRRIFSSDRHLDFKKLMDEGAIVLVNMNSARPESSPIASPEEEMFAALLINEIYRESLRRDPRDPELRNFTLYIDECHRYLTGDIEKMLAELRKFRTSVVLAHQWLTQIKDEDLRKSIIAGCQSKVIFQLGDIDDCYYWARQLFNYSIDKVEQWTHEVIGYEKIELKGESSSSSSTSSKAQSSARSTTKTKTEAEGKTKGHSHASGTSSSSSWGDCDMSSMSGAVVLGAEGDFITMNEGSSSGSSFGGGTGKSEMSGYVDASSIIKAIAEASGEMEGLSSSSTRSRSRSRSKNQALKPILRRVPKSFVSVENQRIMRAQEIKSLPIAQAVLRIAGQQPLLLQAIFVDDIEIKREDFDDWVSSIKERTDELFLVEDARRAGIVIEEYEEDFDVVEEEGGEENA